VARFSREARAAAKIKSEYVARTLDVGKLESGCPYIVMEYLDGTDLSQRIAERGPLPVGDAVRFILQACDALSEAHALGIIHRDLKPSNLFVTQRRDGAEVTKMLDFGISKLSPSAGSAPELSMTRTTSVMGSPLYMSPEQLVASRNVDPRSDIWALGVTLYEALAGKPPFGGDSLPELCAKVMTQPAPPLSSARPDVSPQLEAVVMRCLEKEPEKRYASAGELAAALTPFAPMSATGAGQQAIAQAAANFAMRGISSGDSVAAQTAQRKKSLGGPTSNAWGHTNDTSIPKHSLWLPITLGLVALAGVALGVVLWRSRTDEPSRVVTQPASSAAVSQFAQPSAAPASANLGAPAVATPLVAPSAGIPPLVVAPAPVKLTGPTDRSPKSAPAAKAKPGNSPKASDKDLLGDRN